MPPDDEHHVEPVTPVAPELRRPRLMRQNWRDLTFVHWAVEPERVAALLPPGVRPDVHEGLTYVGLVPFRVVDTGLPRGPAVPWAGRFLETNVRLYSVDRTGRRGVVFLSMDADRSIVVAGARTVLGLPYRWGRLRHSSRETATGEEHTYEATLRHPGAWGASSRVVVSTGEPVEVSPLDDFLLSRWGLHVAHLGRTWYLPIEHAPWTVRRAELQALDDGLVASVGLGELMGRPPDHVAFSDGVDAEFGLPVLAGTRDARLPRTVRGRP
jgi:uncharacterized protein YqjF (DUF2071 family)